MPEFKVYAHFDKSDVQKYVPPKAFATMSVTNRPHACTVGFLLCEKDNGGMSSLLDKGYAKLQEEVEKRMEKPSENDGDGKNDTWKAEIWKAVKEYLYAYLKARITQGINDDVFPPQDAVVELTGRNHTWNGGKTSPKQEITFKGHKGEYLMTYDWQLSD